MSPDQLRQVRPYDPRLYTHVILHHLLNTGTHPVVLRICQKLDVQIISLSLLLVTCLSMAMSGAKLTNQLFSQMFVVVGRKV